MLKIQGLRASVAGVRVLCGVGMEISAGEAHFLMGPNGSGKSSLAMTLMGNPLYRVGGGEVKLEGKDVLKMSVEERAKAGLFLSFQNPVVIPGVSVFHFLREAYGVVTGKKVNVLEFKRKLEEMVGKVGLDSSIIKRYVNDGFSGGERKKLEILQMLILEPRMVILDEIDSGLDVDSLKLISKVIKRRVEEKVGFLIITHRGEMMRYFSPDKVHVMKKGLIVRSGGKEVVKEIESNGYKNTV